MSEPTPVSTPNNPAGPHGPEWVSLRPSRWLSRAHGGVLLALSLLPLVAVLNGTATAFHWLLLVVFEGTLLVEYWRFCRWRSGAPPEAVACEADGTWALFWDGRRAAAELVGERVVWPWLQVLRLTEVETGRRHTLIVLPDSADREERRRLRLWMRLGRG
ncbi:protein YgfX [Marinimicrobium locisalis]|uniref:protein YgfX n=1 Tax=Marinimicrobium locisalis TaxID=546022 RepID=UPI0032213EE4